MKNTYVMGQWFKTQISHLFTLGDILATKGLLNKIKQKRKKQGA